MPTFLFANRATSTLAAAINTTDTTITLAGGTGSRFPSPAPGQVFRATLVASDGTSEIVECTARSLDTLTVVRGVEGTTPAAFAVGSRVELRLTAGVMQAFLQGNVLPPLGANLDLNGYRIINADWSGVSEFVRPTRRVDAGSGLLGGGALDIDRTLSLDFATPSDMTAGTSTTKVLSPGIVAPLFTNVIAKTFESVQTISALPALITVAHGLGGRPAFAAAWFRCRIANNGYVVGDDIDIGSVRQADNQLRPMLVVTSLELRLLIPNNIKVKTLATNNTVADFNPADWDAVLQAWRVVR